MPEDSADHQDGNGVSRAAGQSASAEESSAGKEPSEPPAAGDFAAKLDVDPDRDDVKG